MFYTVVEQVAEVIGGLTQYKRISDSRPECLRDCASPKAVGNLGLMVSQTSPSATITQSFTIIKRLSTFFSEEIQFDTVSF